jgi:MacB-like periplasmic core domain
VENAHLNLIGWGIEVVIGRLRKGVTLQEAEQREIALLRRLPSYIKGLVIHVRRAQDQLTFRAKNQVTLLAVAGCFVAIVSLGSLLLLSSARAAESRKNTAVRVVLGGTITSLWRDEILWWLCIGALGSSVIIFGTGFLATIIRKMQGLSVPRLNEVGLGAPQALYIFLATIAAACLLSLPYILSSIRLKELTPILNRAGFQSEIKLKPIVGRLVTFAQLALALALTATALRVCVHYFYLASIPAGIDASNVFVASADPILSHDGATPSLVTGTAKANKKDSAPEAKDKDKAAAKGEDDGLAEKIKRKEDLDRKTLLLTQEVARRPGVASVAVVDLVPFGVFAGSGQFVASVQGGPETFASSYVARGDLPRTLGLSMLTGRWFDQNDEAGGNGDVVVVSKALSEQSYGGQAVGKQLWIAGQQSPRNIVGVVNDVLANFGEEIQPAFYVPIIPGRDQMLGLYSIVVKMSNPGAVPPQINLPANSELQYGDWTNLSKMMEEAGVTDRVSALTAAWFAGFALLLAATSTYAVVWTMTMQRQREMAIRMSFGASPFGLALRTFRDGAALALLAGVGGLAIEKALERWLWSHFYGFPAFSWFSFAASLAVILAMTILAAAAPARSIVALSPGALLREN